MLKWKLNLLRMFLVCLVFTAPQSLKAEFFGLDIDIDIGTDYYGGYGDYGYGGGFDDYYGGYGLGYYDDIYSGLYSSGGYNLGTFGAFGLDLGAYYDNSSLFDVYYPPYYDQWGGSCGTFLGGCSSGYDNVGLYGYDLDNSYYGFGYGYPFDSFNSGYDLGHHSGCGCQGLNPYCSYCGGFGYNQDYNYTPQYPVDYYYPSTPSVPPVSYFPPTTTNFPQQPVPNPPTFGGCGVGVQCPTGPVTRPPVYDYVPQTRTQSQEPTRFRIPRGGVGSQITHF